MIVLITGGSKSGKSSYAEKLVTHLIKNTPAHYIATMRVFSKEEETIVKRHQEYRKGKNFIVHECPLYFPLTFAKDTVLLEDVPNLLANHMFGGDGINGAKNEVKRLSQSAQNLVIVTNEVGSCVLKYADETDNYIEALGQLNRSIAKDSDCVVEVVAGIPLAVKGVLPI